jgi:Protein kinase domain
MEWFNVHTYENGKSVYNRIREKKMRRTVLLHGPSQPVLEDDLLWKFFPHLKDDILVLIGRMDTLQMYRCVYLCADKVYTLEIFHTFRTAPAYYATELKVQMHLANQHVVCPIKLKIDEDKNAIVTVKPHYPNGSVYKCLQTLSFEERKRGVLNIIEAVEAMHAVNMVHGDICSKNVFVSESREFYLGGFTLSSDWTGKADDDMMWVPVGRAGYSPWQTWDSVNLKMNFKKAKQYDYFALFVFICEVLFRNRCWAFDVYNDICDFQQTILNLPPNLYRSIMHTRHVIPKMKKKYVGVKLIEEHDKVLFGNTFDSLKQCLKQEDCWGVMKYVVNDCTEPNEKTGYEALSDFWVSNPLIRWCELVESKPGNVHFVKYDDETTLLVFETKESMNEFSLTDAFDKVQENVYSIRKKYN